MKYPQMSRNFTELTLKPGVVGVVYDQDDDMMYFILDTQIPIEEYAHSDFIAGLDEFGCVVRVAVRSDKLDFVDTVMQHCHIKRLDELALRMIDYKMIAEIAK